jgi:hypothetical protein
MSTRRPFGDGPVDRPVDRRRAWFGPKRIGCGIRPQTWQGWVIVLFGTAAICLLVHFI